MLSVGSLCVVDLLTNQVLDGRRVTGATTIVTYHCALLIIYLNILSNIRMNLIGYIGLEICRLTMFGAKQDLNSSMC